MTLILGEVYYEIPADQLPKLCEYLQCGKEETVIVAEFKKRLETWENPIEITDLCRKANIEFQVYHWY